MERPEATVKRRTFRARSYRPVGFTLIEVLITLLVAVTMVSVVCVSLITALKAEQAADDLRESVAVLDRVSSEVHLGLSETGLSGSVCSDWVVRSEYLPASPDVGNVPWRIWFVSPKDRPSTLITAAFRVSD